ncbi:substrate-binding domain-containing protein [Desulfogranum marinum]|uniref:substrate-binding domain-containing protein n=1 Tax=Desulfogranum marinum TaxID=453220 RepID=UPI0029C7CE8F|nr:substrate-binding domain-containing protein [Desulfogranum marinum]
MHNDTFASAMLLTFNRLGVQVPEDKAVTGFNNLVTGRLTSPRLTTTHSPRRKIGKIAAESALKRINGEKLESNIINLGFRLIEGESTQQ